MKKKGKSVHCAKHYVLRGQGRKTPLKGLQVNAKILSEARGGCGRLLLDETCRLALFLGLLGGIGRHYVLSTEMGVFNPQVGLHIATWVKLKKQDC